MNTIKVYKTDGTLKYTFLPSSASTQEADGHISSQSCYMASDDTGAELEGGSCDFEVLSKKVLEFSSLMIVLKPETKIAAIYINTHDGTPDYSNKHPLLVRADLTELYKICEKI